MRDAGGSSVYATHRCPRRSCDEPLPFVNVELHGAFVSHFQQQRLASFLIGDIRALHHFEDFEWLFAKRGQDFFSIIQHFISSTDTNASFVFDRYWSTRALSALIPPGNLFV